VLDSVGIGAMPDAALYHDEGSNTLKNTAAAVGGIDLPNLDRLGLFALTGYRQKRVHTPQISGAYGRMQEQSPGKDTTTGHWEMMGIILERPFPTYPHGFPPEVINALTAAIGRPVLGNKPASGVAIINELGAQHLATGAPIVYTSADSVLQIAAHEEVIPLSQLYAICEQARQIMTGEHAVGRIIARPFRGTPGAFQRTANRKDFSLEPPYPHLLDLAVAQGLVVVGIGKIGDIFAGRGITTAVHTKNDMEGVDLTLRYLQEVQEGIIFTNLISFDMLYGHRNDAQGYAKALEDFDRRLPELLVALGPDDLLFITADHGCDPTTPSSDHSREYTPLLVAGAKVKPGTDLGTRQSFADLGATIAQYFGLPWPNPGQSFQAILMQEE